MSAQKQQQTTKNFPFPVLRTMVNVGTGGLTPSFPLPASSPATSLERTGLRNGSYNCISFGIACPSIDSITGLIKVAGDKISLFEKKKEKGKKKKKENV